MLPPARTHHDHIRPAGRRTLLIVLTTALLITSCGSDSDSADEDTLPAADDTAADTPPSLDDSSTSTEASSAGTRVVTDGTGEEVEIPVAPQRVITTEQILDLLVLGVSPVGSRNLDQDTRAFPEFDELLVDTVDLGTEDLDLEEVVALEPDLIITTLGRLDVADQFREIAPTVFQDIQSPDKKHRWDETLLFVGDVVGKQQEAADLLAAYKARLEDFKAQMGDRLADTTVSVIRVGDDNLKIYTVGSFAGGVLQDAGILRPENQNLDAFETEKLTNGSDTEGFDLSTERLREADADVIFVVVDLPTDEAEYDDEDRLVAANAAALQSNPLWTQLEAAQNGQTFEVGRHWNGESLVDANRMLDDMFALLLGNQ